MGTKNVPTGSLAETSALALTPRSDAVTIILTNTTFIMSTPRVLLHRFPTKMENTYSNASQTPYNRSYGLFLTEVIHCVSPAENCRSGIEEVTVNAS
jgi:hypothetical protein